MEEVSLMNNEYDTTQYIVINIGDEQYGIDIKYVDNIVRMQKITRVPNCQEYFKGVINLRGEVVPVMSLRRRMDLDDDEFTSNAGYTVSFASANDAIGIIIRKIII